MVEQVPLYDDAGLNLADPNDTRGHKTSYITTLQVEALRRYVGPVSGLAIDVGCGYGRMSEELRRMGCERLVAIDPSERVLGTARRLCPHVEFRQGALPDLPVDEGEAETVFLLNVLRSLHLMGMTKVASGVARPLAPGGRLVVLDNMREGHPDYVKEADLVALFNSAGLRLVSRHAIRGARWPWIFAVQFGLVPRRWHMALARLELWWMSRYRLAPRFQYHNVIWIFEKLRCAGRC